jgi:two-component system, OmpR family, sensor histidine kinase KdpD
MSVEHPRDPEALLRQVEAAERAERRGQLKIFLGYASGVGKSFKLFDEGRRRRSRSPPPKPRR